MEYIPGGYILLARKIIESEIWSKPPLYLKVWVFLLNQAQHSQFKGLEKGQLFTSIPKIQEACSWYVGCRKVTPTKDQIFQVLEWMRKACAQDCAHNPKATMIATTKATHGILVTIHNYSIYQNPKYYESNDEPDDEKDSKATRKQRQPDNINKNDKNVKNDKKDIYGEFGNVLLTEKERQGLDKKYGNELAERTIAFLDSYIEEKGYKSKSHNLAIQRWVINAVSKDKPKQQQFKRRDEPEVFEC